MAKKQPNFEYGIEIIDSAALTHNGIRREKSK